jgi:hypothetical protein
VDPRSELVNCIQRLHVTLERSIRLVDTLIAVMIGQGPTEALREESAPIPDQVAGAVPLMLQAAGSSSNTIAQLSDAPGLQTRDCYSIARSVVEIAVNICYIFAEGAAAAELAQRHARQKAYRDLVRESKIGDSRIRLECAGRPAASSIEGMEAQIAEFTAKGGREKGWMDASIDDRIEAVGKRFGGSVLSRLHFARFMVYRHSSEVLHGTLFSAIYFFGATTPTGEPRTLEQTTDFIGQQHMMILLATIFALLAVVEVFHRAYGFRAAFESAERLLEALREIPILNPALVPNPTQASEHQKGRNGNRD